MLVNTKTLWMIVSYHSAHTELEKHFAPHATFYCKNKLLVLACCTLVHSGHFSAVRDPPMEAVIHL